MAAAIAESLQAVRHHPDGPRWVPPDDLHVTVRFLGDLTAADVADVRSAVETAAERAAPFRIVLGPAGGLERPRARGVAWLAVMEGDEPISAIASHLMSCLRGTPVGRRLQEGPAPVRPHLTIARGASAGFIAALGDMPGPAAPIIWEADSMQLLRSHTAIPGPRYRAIIDARFAGPPARRGTPPPPARVP